MPRASTGRCLILALCLACSNSGTKRPPPEGAGGMTATAGHAGTGDSGAGGSSAASGGVSGSSGATAGSSAASGSSGRAGAAGDSAAGGSAAKAGSGPDDVAGSGGEGGAADAESLCQAYALASCTRHLRCDRLDFTQHYGSVERCQERTLPICLDELSAAGTGITLVAVDSCIDALNVASCEAGLSRPLPACTFAGDKSDGAGCRYDSQCASAFCNRPLRSWCGTCAAQASAGGECDRNRPNGCATGLACVSSGTCVAPMASGAACASSADCSGGLRCNRESVRRCAPRARLNETCAEVVDCDPTLGLYCNESGLCAVAEYANAGDACDFEGGSYCAASSSCKSSEGLPAPVGTCEAPRADGEACDLMAGDGCDAPALCIESRCEPPAPASTCPD
jgi:hypothetical protein